MTVGALRLGGETFTTDRWRALGTTAVLCTIGSDHSAARAAVDHELDRITEAASRFSEASELSRINRAAGQRVSVSRLMLEALELAVHAARITAGAVDPTLAGQLIELGYDRDWDELEHVPAVMPIEADHAPAGPPRNAVWHSIELWADPPAARVPAGVQLDLGATAKAFAADRGARAARVAAGGGVLVSLGGDIATNGPAPPGGWLVRVTDDHRDPASGAGQTVTIQSGGLATSSLVPRRWFQAGRAIHHVLDPRTGRPVRPVWRTASVAAASCADANIASTAALVMGTDAAAWLSDQALPARLTAVDGTVTRRGGWPQ